MSQTRTSRICIICVLASFMSGIAPTAAGFSFGGNNPARNDPRITSNRPWGNIEAPKPTQKYQKPPAIPDARYPGAAPGNGWYASPVPGNAVAAAGEQPVVEIETDSTVLYEQQNTVYTVRVVSAENLKTLIPQIPRMEGATLEQLDGPVASTRTSAHNGAREIVNEYHFKLTPFRSGEIVVPAIRFTGTHVPGRQWNVPPGMPASTAENSFSISSGSPLTLRVLPAEPAVTPWLPLNDLRLRMHLSGSGPAKAGEPVTLTLELTARGAQGAQLPSLESQLKSNDFRAYRDSVAISNGISRDGTQLLGSRKETYTIIPLRDGWIRLPAIQVAWWNVDNDTAMLAEVPGLNPAATAAGNGQLAMPSGDQELMPVYAWAPMLIIMGLIAGYWLGAWARTRPLLRSIGSRIGGSLSVHAQGLVRYTADFSSRLSPLCYLDKLRLAIAFILPRRVRLWLCVRCIESEHTPEAWCNKFRSRICSQLGVSRHAPISSIAEKIIELQAPAEPARLRALVQSMDSAVYGAAPLDFAAWKKDLRYQLRPRLFQRRRPRRRRASGSLPALNPHSA